MTAMPVCTGLRPIPAWGPGYGAYGAGLLPRPRLRFEYRYAAGGELVMLAELWCDQKTRDRLGEAGLAEVTDSLWAQDCQTRGHALGGEPPALCVDELREYATAGLHHRLCRPARVE